MPEIVPAKVVLVLSPPVVRKPPPSATTLPAAPVNEPMVWLAPFRSSVAPPALRLTAVAEGNCADWPAPNHLSSK